MSAVAAKIAVSAATYGFDRPYEYLIPEELEGKVFPGQRVFVPFASGNRISEGLVLSLTDSPSYEFAKLKPIHSLIDVSPVISSLQLKLALFMQERCFCTVYDALKAMLPTGMLVREDGRTRVTDKTIDVARLLISGEEALSIAESLPSNYRARASVLRELAGYGQMPVRDLMMFCGIKSKTSINRLVKDGYIEIDTREVLRIPRYTAGKSLQLPELNRNQSAVYEGIKKLISDGGYREALLQGITGSGKTSVYIRLINDVLNSGKTAILLVPEIALTPQMLNTFSSYFGDDIAVLHSSLSAGERYDEWKRLKTGRAHLAIGTRSAIFAPLDNLGIVIIDEEQEESYISENNPRYDARIIAKFLCYKSSCLFLSGSATPDICSKYDAETGKSMLFRLDERYNKLSLPNVKIVSLKDELKAGNEGPISSYLKDELQKNIDNGEQSILFLNRRGARRLIKCPECDFEFTCPNCSVNLTYHSANNRLICHYCGYSAIPPKACPECSGTLKMIGIGTQLVEDKLHEMFPDTGIIRMDADALCGGVTHEQIFEKFRRENIPIMVGTQMVTKGLNFENVTLVGVLLADQGLDVCSVRASERTFSLITQVIGRSGRGKKEGRAVIQTYSPENEVILQASSQDYDGFYKEEIKVRSVQDAPPFADILSVCTLGQDEMSVIEECKYIRSELFSRLKDQAEIIVMGPSPFPVVKVNNTFRYRVVIKCRANKIIRAQISKLLIELYSDKRFKMNTVYADTNPEF